MPETILIVDDTPANLGVLVETLGGAGYRLMVAEDGEEALEQVTQTIPDLILLDVMMPGIDGFETCRRLKGRTATREIPVLFMTALGETADKVRAFAAGGVDYLTKPFEHEEALARVRTHLALRRLRRDIEEQLVLQERFRRIAGHDLRNPIFLIQLAVEAARREVPAGASAELELCLEDIARGAAQMRRIVDTFLEIRPAGGPPGAPARTDLNLLAEAVVRSQARAAERKEITLVWAPAADLPPVRGDAGHVFQALTNLVGNAVKFTPPGGGVTVATVAAGRRVRFTVRDTGPGVPVAERAGLFSEQARLSPRPTGGEESHGLGLAIVKHLIEGQGGAVGADFPAAGGSLFWFELPAV